MSSLEISMTYGNGFSNKRGFIIDGGIVLNLERFNASTVFHEFGHYYSRWLAQYNPEAHKSLMENVRNNFESSIKGYTNLYNSTGMNHSESDIIEEIFGEIEDEHDKDDLVEQKISDTHFRFSARVEIDYINEHYNLNVPESEEYETLGGFILYKLANIPEKNSKLKMEGFAFVVEEVTDRRIEIVSVYLKS